MASNDTRRIQAVCAHIRQGGLFDTHAFLALVSDVEKAALAVQEGRAGKDALTGVLGRLERVSGCLRPEHEKQIEQLRQAIRLFLARGEQAGPVDATAQRQYTRFARRAQR